MKHFSWAHIADLRLSGGGRYLLDEPLKVLRLDLEGIKEETGSVSAVFFSGDLKSAEFNEPFQELTALFDDIGNHIKGLTGSSPALLAVPGNHDTVLSGVQGGVAHLVKYWESDETLRAFCPTCGKDEFWITNWQDTIWAEGPMPPMSVEVVVVN